MLDILSGVVRNLVAIIMVAAVLELLLPRNDFRPYINMVIGLVMILTILAPVRAMLRLPVELEPSFFGRPQTYPEADFEVQAAALDHLNWELTLGRFRTLLAERIAALLEEEGYALVNVTFDMVEDPGRMDFGLLHYVTVWARRDGAESLVPPVEAVRIGDAGLPKEQGDDRTAGELALKIASALGLEREKVEVHVLNQ